jgi:signal transduction histidine kinase
MASDTQLFRKADFREAFLANERQVRIDTGKLACALVFVLMPLGVTADYFLYRDHVVEFLRLRLLCSLSILGIWLLHYTSLARKFYPLVGMPIGVLPACFIALMMCKTEGAASPYYAAFNLILLAVSAVGHWSTAESLLETFAIFCVYLATYYLTPAGKVVEQGVFFTHAYFIALTGIIVVCGNYLFNRLRFREFALRYELDRNKKVLEETNQKLLELDQVKNRFFANISHELRTPLTLLLAPMETLIHRFKLEPRAMDLLATMQANGMRLLKMINDLLELVRLESGRMEIKEEPLGLDEFVKGLVSSAKQMAEDKGQQLLSIVDPEIGTVLADRDKLEKIVLNLVFNALKFTPSGGKVQIRAEKQANELVLSVSDTGVGIAAKNLPYVFDRFWQVDDSSKRKFQGVGIGLALVKELAELQKGKVSVQSEEGKGTLFTVRLPYVPTQNAKLAPSHVSDHGTTDPATAAATVSSQEWLSNLYRRAEFFPGATRSHNGPAQTARSGQKPTLLVADDEPDMLRFLSSQLEWHYNVVLVVNGQEAVDKAKELLPDIILLDMMMPEKDGLQACREIREHQETKNIPIVLLTARADEETKLTSLSAGASDFLAKPFSTTELYVRIKNLVDGHNFQRSLAKQNVVLESTIEQLKDTESQLVQSEKMRSLGKMSAGIMHEVGNAINYPKTGVYRLRKMTALMPPERQKEVQGILGDVEEGLNRVANIVSDLRKFTHPDLTSMDRVDVNLVVNSALRFLSGDWKESVQFERNLPAGFTVWSNTSLLVHVLVNLLQNSLDALKEKAFDNGEKPTIWIEGRLEQDKGILVVRDNGTGIDPKHMNKIFDPFFTTKDVGKGMGLGLSICYGIIKQCSGRVWVSRTEPGRLCEFTLEFPITKPQEAAV